MKTYALLQKQDDGKIYCQVLSKKGKEYIYEDGDEEGHWEEGGTKQFRQ